MLTHLADAEQHAGHERRTVKAVVADREGLPHSAEQHLLVRHGVYVRTCSDKIGLDGEFLRIASRGLRENQQIIDALTDVLGPKPT